MTDIFGAMFNDHLVETIIILFHYCSRDVCTQALEVLHLYLCYLFIYDYLVQHWENCDETCGLIWT